jgi:hypothetical protein
LKNGSNHTSGTASLSACALAASVVTVLFTNADLENAELRSGAARLVRNARENIVVAVKECLVKREEESWSCRALPEMLAVGSFLI